MLPQPTVHDVDLEPESNNFARSVDPFEILTENADETADSILNTDHSSRPIIENNANADLEVTNLHNFLNITATSFSMFTSSGS